jgi:outer membrane protein OmpA-like peptidoglycan-associated protein
MPSVEAVVQALTTKPASRPLPPGWSGAPSDGAPSQDLLVAFEGGTHRLTVHGMTVLRVVGVALRDPRVDHMRVQIAGHAFAPGDPLIGQSLSEKRAQAVADHLAMFYGIAPDVLVPLGYGASRLIDRSNPASPLNQRIQVINLSQEK